MAEFIMNLITFGAKALVVTLFIIAVLSVFFSMLHRSQHKESLEIEDFSYRYKGLAQRLRSAMLNKKQLKAEAKKIKKDLKEKKQQNAFIIDFEGDMKASCVESLREEINTILSVAGPQDEVLVRLESGGGTVHGYGLAAAQLRRVRDKKVRLVVCVDKVAASGGYLMASVADEILASPFAIIGSIGVLAQVPNLSKLLKKHDIEYEEICSGDYKRTVSLLAPITTAGKEKFTEQISEVHDLFKKFVASHRPQLDLAKVATGEHWLGSQALDLRLVDRLSTSDEYIQSLLDKKNVFHIKYEEKKTLSQRLSSLAMTLSRKILSNLSQYARSTIR